MPQLTIARMGSANPMGAESYQRHIVSRAAEALGDQHGPGWTVREIVARSVRSTLPGNRRLPSRWLMSAGVRSRRAVGRVIYPPSAVVHRMNLELPPGTVGDVVTLHDVVAWECADESAPVRAAADELRAADAVICVSEYTAERAGQLFGLHNLDVVPNGVDAAYLRATPATDEQLDRVGVHRPYALVAGGASLRKNLGSLAEAWPGVLRSRPDLTLVLAGNPHPRRNALFDGLSGTRIVGRVPDDLMPSIVAAAAVVVVPSLVEGFGLPAVEAMAAGVPVVAAKTSSLPEVVGDAGVLVEPTPAGLEGGILAATADDDVRRELSTRGRARAARFTWERSAAGHAKVWTRVAGVHGGRSARRRTPPGTASVALDRHGDRS